MKSKLIFLLCLSISGWAQAPPQEATTVVEGTITDPTGAAVVVAKISIQSAGGAHYEAVTDTSGHYQIANPAAGTYTVTAEGKGFRLTTTQVTVVAGEVATADFKLALAEQSANVLVTDTTSPVFGEKSGIPIEQVPQGIQVVNEADILNINAISLGDTLTVVPFRNSGCAA